MAEYAVTVQLRIDTDTPEDAAARVADILRDANVAMVLEVEWMLGPNGGLDSRPVVVGPKVAP